ncbi:MAG: pyridoxamine 5'-phosphate oxidase family protein [Alphaproteobacteria bacterium]|nr:pyridoxamine 5'-phosphate oxidase family protein [Alphaproteobacteria bacterium]
MPVGTLSGASQDLQIERLLAAAREVMSEVPYCWVVTASGGGGANARAVKAFPNAPGEDVWARWFLTNRVGRKATEIRDTGRATLAYQQSSGDAYVALVGRAAIVDDDQEVERRLKEVYDPEGTLAGQLVAVRVTGERLELHLRGVTAEPWGRGRTWLDRLPDGSWRLVD